MRPIVVVIGSDEPMTIDPDGKTVFYQVI